MIMFVFVVYFDVQRSQIERNGLVLDPPSVRKRCSWIPKLSDLVVSRTKSKAANV